MIFTTLIITRDCLSDPTIGLHALYEPVHKFGHLFLSTIDGISLSTIVNLESKKVHATMLHRESMSSPFSTSLSKLQALVLISTNHLDTNHKAQQPCKTIKKRQKPSKILLVYWMRSNSEDIDECHVIDHHQQTLFDNSNTLQKKSSLVCLAYAWPSGEVFRDYKYLYAEIYFVPGNFFNLPNIPFSVP